MRNRMGRMPDFGTPVYKYHWTGLQEGLGLVVFFAVKVALAVKVLLYDNLSFSVSGVKFGPFVGRIVNLEVLRELEGEVLALPEPYSRDGGLVGLSEEDHTAEGVLTHAVQTLHHT